jgi:pimeloyl-ACP methyl ester carboxylesterase
MFMDSTAKALSIRLIAPDRPGVGQSTFQENRTFLSWGKDMAELVDVLHVEHYSVFGLSGGAPHVLSCVLSDSARIDNASIISGATPYDYKGTLRGMWFPVKLIHWFAGMRKDRQLRKFIQNDYESLVEKPEKRIKQFQNYLPKPDRILLTQHPVYAWEFIRGSIESYSQGIDGVVQEWKLYVADWDMDFAKVNLPINLWYGKDDKMAPFQRGEYYHKSLPTSSLKVLNNEGHFSLIRNHITEILEELKPGHGAN